MSLNEASKAGLIEPIAAVLFRAMAIVFVLAFFRALSMSLYALVWSFFAPHANAGILFMAESVGIMLLGIFLLGLPIPLVLFIFSLRLARLTSVSLSRALASKSQT